jgi:hypothetical protein
MQQYRFLTVLKQCFSHHTLRPPGLVLSDTLKVAKPLSKMIIYFIPKRTFIHQLLIISYKWKKLKL